MGSHEYREQLSRRTVRSGHMLKHKKVQTWGGNTYEKRKANRSKSKQNTEVCPGPRGETSIAWLNTRKKLCRSTEPPLNLHLSEGKVSSATRRCVVPCRRQLVLSAVALG